MIHGSSYENVGGHVKGPTSDNAALVIQHDVLQDSCAAACLHEIAVHVSQPLLVHLNWIIEWRYYLS